MTPLPTLRRDDLFRVFDNPRLVVAFEQQSQVLAETQDAVTTGAAATDALQDATVLTLSPNGAFNNERVLKLGRGVKAVDDGQFLTISASDEVPQVAGGFAVQLTAQGPTVLVLPLAGNLATQDQRETLYAKTLNMPSFTGLSDYADDVAAAAGSVPVGGAYRTGSAVKVRVA